MYDRFAKLVTKFVQSLMMGSFHMRRVQVPFPADNSNKEGPVSVFLSPDYDTNKDKCIIIIQGTGKVEAG